MVERNCLSAAMAEAKLSRAMQETRISAPLPCHASITISAQLGLRYALTSVTVRSELSVKNAGMSASVCRSGVVAISFILSTNACCLISNAYEHDGTLVSLSVINPSAPR